MDLDPIFADTLSFFRDQYPELNDGYTLSPHSLSNLTDVFLNRGQDHDALQDATDLKDVCRAATPCFSITRLKRFYQWEP